MEPAQLNEDLRFIRSMVERTQSRIDPGAPFLITWGLICLVGFPLSGWLQETGRADQVNALWLILALVGASLSSLFGYRIARRRQSEGVSSYISKQIGWVWWLLVPNGIVWSALASSLDPKLGVFVWAGVYGIGLAMMGILYSKEWLLAGIGVFVAIPMAALLRPHSSTILGVMMGLGCIVPALIALRRQRRWKTADARA